MSNKNPTDIDRDIAQRVRAARLAAGWSQQRLADAVGITFQQVQKYEAARNRVSASRLFVIAAAFGRPVTDLLPGEDSPTFAPVRAVEDARVAKACKLLTAALVTLSPAGSPT